MEPIVGDWKVRLFPQGKTVSLLSLGNQIPGHCTCAASSEQLGNGQYSTFEIEGRQYFLMGLSNEGGADPELSFVFCGHISPDQSIITGVCVHQNLKNIYYFSAVPAPNDPPLPPSLNPSGVIELDEHTFEERKQGFVNKYHFLGDGVSEVNFGSMEASWGPGGNHLKDGIFGSLRLPEEPIQLVVFGWKGYKIFGGIVRQEGSTVNLKGNYSDSIKCGTWTASATF